jgi:hypothetical protein
MIFVLQCGCLRIDEALGVEIDKRLSPAVTLLNPLQSTIGHGARAFRPWRAVC